MKKNFYKNLKSLNNCSEFKLSITILSKVFFIFTIIIHFNLKAQVELNLETVLQKGHTAYITAYDFSPDNRYLLTGSFDNSIILWDINSAKQIRTISGSPQTIRSLVYSPNGKFVLSVCADKKIRLFQVDNGALIQTFEKEHLDFRSAYFSPKGSYVYGLDNSDKVVVWKVGQSKEISTFHKDYSVHHQDALMNEEETKLLSSNSNRESFVIDVKSLDTLLKIPFDKIHAQSFSPNGKLIAISSRKLFTKVFDAETGVPLLEIANDENQCDGCNTKHHFSPDSKLIATASKYNNIEIYAVNSKKLVQTIKNDNNETPDQLLFSPTGKYLLVRYDEEVYVYQLSSGKQVMYRKDKLIDYLMLNFSSNDKYLALPNEDGRVSIVFSENGKLYKDVKGYLNIPNNAGLGLSYSNWIQQSVLTYITKRRKVCLSPDDTELLIGGIDSSAFLINMKTGKVSKVFKGHSKTVFAFDFSPDGNMIATAGGDRKIILWDRNTGERIKVLKGCQELIFDLAFSKDGKSIVSGTWDGVIRLWNLESGDFSYIELENNSPYTVGFSPDNLYLVTGDLNKSISFWEGDSKERFRDLAGHTDIVSSFDFSPDGKHMVTTSWDGSVKIWDVLTGMLIGKHKLHNGAVYAAVYDPKSRFVASGGSDNMIYLWNPISNLVVDTLKGHATEITSIDISTDGKFLISISADGAYKVWDLETFKLLYSRVQLGLNDWLSTSPNGYFDGSPNALGYVNYVKGNEVLNLNSIFEEYFTPNLIQRIFNAEEFEDRSELLNSTLNNIPEVILRNGTGDKRGEAIQFNQMLEIKEATFHLQVELPKTDLAINEILIYNNGKLIVQQLTNEEISFRGGGKKRDFEISLVPGKNNILVKAIDENRTESEPALLEINYNNTPDPVDLYVFSIGINDYENPAYSLSYAVNDAKSFQKAIEKGGQELFASIKTYSLLNKEATKIEVQKIIAEIQNEIGPEDVFLFYYAGHGVMSQNELDSNQEFFIVTYDVTNLYARHHELAEKAISAKEIMQFAINIKAEKQLFVLDACQSGGALNDFAKRGNEKEKALAQLARNTGTFFLTASQDSEFANEVGRLNHGLFTYAVLELIEGSAQLNQDNKITVNELKSYVEERVPELSKVYKGSAQYPTGYSFGRDFPIVILK